MMYEYIEYVYWNIYIYIEWNRIECLEKDLNINGNLVDIKIVF